jgi:hypothetical protein
MDADSVPTQLSPQDIRAIRPHQAETTSHCDYTLGQWSRQNGNRILLHFLQSSQSWAQERVPVPRRLRWVLCTLIPVELFWLIWLATIVAGAASCRPICRVATLDHAGVLLACGAFCVAPLSD